MLTAQAKTSSDNTTTSNDAVDPSKTISFSTNISGINITSTINASLSCPSSIDAGDSGTGTLSVTAGTSSISFTLNYLLGTYDVSLPSFTTPLGSTDIPLTQIMGAGLKARFTAYVSASVSSSPSGLVSPTSLTYTSATSNSLSISTGTLCPGSISVSSSYTYDGTIEIILSLPLLGDHTVLGPYDISSVTGSDTLSTTVIVKATPVITWSNPADITYGTALSNTQLDATASNPASGASVDGSFVYSPVSGTVLSAGSHTLSVTFTPTDTTYYNTATDSVTIDVLKATPVITWSNPADITYGTALSGTQLNASANVAGSFAYTPAAGTVLSAGSYTLSVTFTPTDTTDYTTATKSVTINVVLPPFPLAIPIVVIIVVCVAGVFALAWKKGFLVTRPKPAKHKLKRKHNLKRGSLKLFNVSP